jgi:hypothetical protein
VTPRYALPLAKILQLLESKNLLTSERINEFSDAHTYAELFKPTLKLLDSVGLLDDEHISMLLTHKQRALKIRFDLIDLITHRIHSHIHLPTFFQHPHQSPRIFLSLHWLKRAHILNLETQSILHQLMELFSTLDVLLFTLYHPNPYRNLLNVKNLKVLHKLAPYANGAITALRAVDACVGLTQNVFDDICAEPTHALIKAYNLNGIPLQGNYDIVAHFRETRKAARTLAQGFRSSTCTFFKLPPELLVNVCTHLKPDHVLDGLDEASVDATAYASFCKPE